MLKIERKTIDSYLIENFTFDNKLNHVICFNVRLINFKKREKL